MPANRLAAERRAWAATARDLHDALSRSLDRARDIRVVTPDELLLALAAHSRIEPVTLAASTAPLVRQSITIADRREPNPLHGHRVEKLQRICGWIGSGRDEHGRARTTYETFVRAAERREGQAIRFRARSIWNGAGYHVQATDGSRRPSPVVCHRDGRAYVMLIRQRALEAVWLIDGVETAADQVLPYLPAERDTPTQSHLAQQVKPRTFGLAGIEMMVVGGTAYVIPRHTAPARAA